MIFPNSNPLESVLIFKIKPLGIKTFRNIQRRPVGVLKAYFLQITNERQYITNLMNYGIKKGKYISHNELISFAPFSIPQCIKSVIFLLLVTNLLKT